jgi:hypothetical protein
MDGCQNRISPAWSVEIHDAKHYDDYQEKKPNPCIHAIRGEVSDGRCYYSGLGMTHSGLRLLFFLFCTLLITEIIRFISVISVMGIRIIPSICLAGIELIQDDSEHLHADA